jgi:hypothetical protein
VAGEPDLRRRGSGGRHGGGSMQEMSPLFLHRTAVKKVTWLNLLLSFEAHFGIKRCHMTIYCI